MGAGGGFLDTGAAVEGFGAPPELVDVVCDEAVDDRENRVMMEAVVGSGAFEDPSLDGGSSSMRETSSKDEVDILL